MGGCGTFRSVLLYVFNEEPEGKGRKVKKIEGREGNEGNGLVLLSASLV